MSEGCSNIGAKVIIVHTDFDRSYAHVDSEEEFSDDETDDMMQAELRQICRLGNKAMLKTFLVDNSEIDLDMMDPEGELHIKKTDTPDWQVYDIAAGKTVLNDRGSLEAATKTAQFDEIVEILFEPGAGCGGGGQPREHTLAQCGSVLPLHHADCGLPAVEGGWCNHHQLGWGHTSPTDELTWAEDFKSKERFCRFQNKISKCPQNASLRTATGSLIQPTTRIFASCALIGFKSARNKIELSSIHNNLDNGVPVDPNIVILMRALLGSMIWWTRTCRLLKLGRK